jgi:hypothetical protein
MKIVQAILKLCCTCRSLSSFVSNILFHSHDINERLGGTSFKNRHDWESDPFVQDFTKWTAESFGSSLLCPKGNSADVPTL